MFSFIKKVLVILKYIDVIIDVLIKYLETVTPADEKNSVNIAKLKSFKNEIA